MPRPIEITRAWAGKVLKLRLPDSHKGQNGRVLIVGGSSRYYGSPALVARAACRAGADLAYFLVPEKIAPVVASYAPDFIVWGYEGSALSGKALGLFGELTEKTDALVIGNGLTKEKGVLETAAELVRRWKKPVVIDADCLGAVRKSGREVLYTPHEVEFRRLGGAAPSKDADERCGQVRKLAAELSAVVLLKGKIDVVSDGERIAVNRTGNSGMTCGGTGDTLAGIAGALLAAGNGTFESACLAAHLNGLAGDLALKELGYSLMASDIAEKVPAAVRSLRGL
ncbi:ADP-dependent (S)-NAD(P)H-hydrate dehydratase [Candidatus Burarchaeum australiense]|nr:ADP-dependent (S)-NAD(P)H-hydrate dehydratase [Candidatus Burarchaeum australiense]